MKMGDKKKSRASKAVMLDKLDATETFGSLFEFLMEFQRMLNREAREDRERARGKQRIRQLSLADRLAAEKEAIDRLLEEAGEKRQRLLSQAIAALTQGLAIGLSQLEFELGAHEDAISHTRRAVKKLLRQLRKASENLET